MWRMARVAAIVLAAWLGLFQGVQPRELVAAAKPVGMVAWQTNYADAVELARQQGKMLFIYFHKLGWNRLGRYYENCVLTAPNIRDKLQDYVCLRLPVNATVGIDGKQIRLLNHGAFAEMCGDSGVVIIDYAHRDAAYHGYVVSALPFSNGCFYTARQMAVVLDLPPGTARERRAEYVARIRSCLPGDMRKSPAGDSEIAWLSDYTQATEQASRESKMLFIFFRDANQRELCDRLEKESLSSADVRKRLQDYVCLRLPLDARVKAEGKDQRLLDYPAFREMVGKPGMAILDYVHRDSKHYGVVVSAFPLAGQLWYTARQTATILDLPPGTLTQRTLIYAVRTHPENPASTAGEFDPYLAEEAESHSQHQADIRLQGHHQWDSRFQRISARLPAGLSASEVCAESWPGQNLVEAATDCVHSWRQSSGHWSAVRSRHRVYGYDMKLGPNGIWYATGIFGRG